MTVRRKERKTKSDDKTMVRITTVEEKGGEGIKIVRGPVPTAVEPE